MTIKVNEPIIKADSAMDRNMKNVAHIVSGMFLAVKSPVDIQSQWVSATCCNVRMLG